MRPPLFSKLKLEAKILRILAVTALCTAALFGVACSDDEDSPNGSTGGESDRESFIQSAENRIAELRSELADLTDQVTSGSADDEVEQQANAVEQRIDEAESELDEIRAANDDEWEDLKDEFDNAIGEADGLLNDIGAELGID